MTPPAAAAAPDVAPRRPLAPRGPRRVSGPARPAAVPRPQAPRRRSGEAGIVLDFVGALEGLAQHRLLDRLIRGRVWIGLVAFALIGIVTLQLGLLKLNGGIGRALEHEALLQRQNATLSIENSEMAAATRVEARATKLGMSFVPGGSLRFLTPHASADAAAASALGSAARASALQAREAAAGTSETAEGAESSAGGEASSGEVATGESGETQASGSTSGESESESTAASEARPTTGEESSATTSSQAAAGTSGGPAPGGGVQAGTTGE